MAQQHSQHLLTALALAEKQQGQCAPNPSVGAVVVVNGQVVATGYHIGCGHPHAEREALSAFAALAIDKAEAILYVTLEPCCHYGRTPPCTASILEHAITTVVYGLQDPNPKMSGKGAAYLTASGVNCIYFPLPEIQQFYRSYVKWWRTGHPWVMAKLAISLDGKIAGEGGQPVKITGEAAQRYTHQQRRMADAILTTARTVMNDDPQLTVRLSGGVTTKPIYIIDRHLDTPGTAQLFSTAARVTIFHDVRVAPQRISVLEDQGAICVALDSQPSQLLAMLDKIGADGVHQLWVEAGGRFFQSLLEHGLVQQALVYVAPKTLGNLAYPGFSCQGNLFASATASRWRVLGQDVVCEFSWMEGSC